MFTSHESRHHRTRVGSIFSVSMKAAAFLFFLACGLLQAARPVRDEFGAFRYQELQFDETGYPEFIGVVFHLPAGIDSQPSPVVLYRGHAASNSPARYVGVGGPFKPTRILADGSREWLIEFSVDCVVEPWYFHRRGKNRWKMPMSGSEDMVFSADQGVVPLLVLDDILIGVEVSPDLPDDGAVRKWMRGDKLPSSLDLSQPAPGSGSDLQKHVASSICPAPTDPASKEKNEPVVPNDPCGICKVPGGGGNLILRTIRFDEGGKPTRVEGTLQVADTPGLAPIFVAVDRMDGSFLSMGGVGYSRAVRNGDIWTYAITLDTEHLYYRANLPKEPQNGWQVFPMSSSQHVLNPGRSAVPMLSLGNRMICIWLSSPLDCDAAISQWITGASPMPSQEEEKEEAPPSDRLQEAPRQSPESPASANPGSAP